MGGSNCRRGNERSHSLLSECCRCVHVLKRQIYDVQWFHCAALKTIQIIHRQRRGTAQQTKTNYSCCKDSQRSCILSYSHACHSPFYFYMQGANARCDGFRCFLGLDVKIISQICSLLTLLLRAVDCYLSDCSHSIWAAKLSRPGNNEKRSMPYLLSVFFNMERILLGTMILCMSFDSNGS